MYLLTAFLFPRFVHLFSPFSESQECKSYFGKRLVQEFLLEAELCIIEDTLEDLRGNRLITNTPVRK